MQLISSLLTTKVAGINAVIFNCKLGSGVEHLDMIAAVFLMYSKFSSYFLASLNQNSKFKIGGEKNKTDQVFQ